MQIQVFLSKNFICNWTWVQFLDQNDKLEMALNAIYNGIAYVNGLTHTNWDGYFGSSLQICMGFIVVPMTIHLG